MSNVEALRREAIDANVFALLAAPDTVRLIIAQAVWGKRPSTVSTAVWSRPAAVQDQEVRQ